MLIRAVAVTVAARISSAVLSFAVFSQVASSLAPAEASRVLFFSFVFGFCLATVRTYHLVAAALSGGETRTLKLRRVRQAAGSLRRLMPWALPAVFLLLLGQGVGWPAAAAGALLVAMCREDLDLVRSVVGRHPVLPVLTAAGGLLGLGLLLWGPGHSVGLCAAAFLVQWLPVALMRLWHGRRWLAAFRAASPSALPWLRRLIDTSGQFLASVFDGAVLNAPYLVVVPLAAAAAVDLALGNRLFVASLALFPLLASWVVSGDMQRIAVRLSMPPVMAFVALQSAVCLATGGAFALVHQVIARQPVGGAAIVVFFAITLAYVMHSAGLRFLLPRLPRAAGLATYALTLASFFTVLLWQYLATEASLAVVVGAVVAALVVPVLVFRGLLHFNGRD